MFRICFLLVCLAAFTMSYPYGPPTSACGNMHPEHGAEVQTSAAPYEIIVSDTCYKENSLLSVRVRINDADDDSLYFEGFFVQARNPMVTTVSHGMFHTMDDTKMQTLDCFGQNENAISHSEHHHYFARTFQWTAPASGQGEIEFFGTIVKGTSTFWEGVTSSSIMYDANCEANATMNSEPFSDIDEADCVASSEEGATCGSSTLTSHALLLSLAVFYPIRRLLN